MKTKLLCILLLTLTGGYAQMYLDTTMVVEKMVGKILKGDGISIGNITPQKDKRSIGYYKCPKNIIGINSGIILSTGYASNAKGPNNSPGISNRLSAYSKEWKGDADLNKLAKGAKTYDVTTIEFDFIPMNNKAAFEYSFGSEEYKENVGSDYNDVFGFFVSGPGIKKHNVALLPDDKRFVTINNVNNSANKKLFVNNDPFIKNTFFRINNKIWIPFWRKIICVLAGNRVNQGDSVFSYKKIFNRRSIDQTVAKTFQYDGFTKKMKASFYVRPYQKYHIKISIADVGDMAFDSGVFLEEKSFVSIKDTTQPWFIDYADKSSYFKFDSAFAMNTMNNNPVIEKENRGITEKTGVCLESAPDVLPANLKKQNNAEGDGRNKNPELKLNDLKGQKRNDKKNNVLPEKSVASISTAKSLGNVQKH